ncbi:MAG: ribose-phosphate diphosphokinase [Pseudomonadota bacterium]
MTDTTPIVLGFTEYAEAGRRFADASDCPFAEISVHQFPDGERRVQLPAELPARVIFCRSLNDPDHKLIELFLAATTARQLGATDLTLVAPYLCYMRQDIAFTPGEAVSQRIIGTLLAQHFDGLITVDPHLHRVQTLGEASPVSRPRVPSTAPVLASFLSEQLDNPLLVGPDEESEQWVGAIAREQELDFVVGRKVRHGDRDVEIELPSMDYRDRQAVLVDDIASTGSTLRVAGELLLAQQVASVDVLVTHALFAGDALPRLTAAGIRNVWSTDAIPHTSNRIHLDRLLAEALKT